MFNIGLMDALRQLFRIAGNGLDFLEGTSTPLGTYGRAIRQAFENREAEAEAYVGAFIDEMHASAPKLDNETKEPKLG